MVIAVVVGVHPYDNALASVDLAFEPVGGIGNLTNKEAVVDPEVHTFEDGAVA